MCSVFQAAAGTRLAQCFLERWETAVLGRDRRLVVERHGERPVDTERRIQCVDGDARPPGPPLGVERVEILRRTGVHRLEAVAHAAWHQPLCAFDQSHGHDLAARRDSGRTSTYAPNASPATTATSLNMSSPCNPRSDPRLVS